MEKRVLLAIVLCFATLYLWQTLVVKPIVKPATDTPRPAAQGTAAATGTPPNPGPVAAAAVAAEAAALEPPLVGDTQERDIRVETRDVIAVFTNRGARLKSWRLKHFLDQEKQPQELVEQKLPTQPLPFTLRTSNEAVTATINDALYTTAGAPSPTV